jgi:hypothetical protein
MESVVGSGNEILNLRSWRFFLRTGINDTDVTLPDAYDAIQAAETALEDAGTQI